MKNPYDVLGVARGSSEDVCAKAFKKLSRIYHPDCPTGDETKFKEVNEAMQAIKKGKTVISSEPVKRGCLRHKTLFTYVAV